MKITIFQPLQCHYSYTFDDGATKPIIKICILHAGLFFEPTQTRSYFYVMFAVFFSLSLKCDFLVWVKIKQFWGIIIILFKIKIFS